MKKYYYLYQTTNLINGKIYIGVHRTDNLDDGYMGSGKLLKRSIEKYGIENFKKEILEHFNNEKNMYQKEIELVDADFILRNDTYNLTEGGNGGTFTCSSMGGKIGGSVPGSGLKTIDFCRKNKIGIFSDERKKYLISEENLNVLKKMCHNASLPKANNKRKETFKKIKHAQGENNSQFGTMWITNDKKNKKIKKEEEIPKGWRKGRVQNIKERSI